MQQTPTIYEDGAMWVASEEFRSDLPKLGPRYGEHYDVSSFDALLH